MVARGDLVREELDEESEVADEGSDEDEAGEGEEDEDAGWGERGEEEGGDEGGADGTPAVDEERLLAVPRDVLGSQVEADWEGGECCAHDDAGITHSS